ncbi:Flavin-dependent oxidoreductase, luciferase family (includes alkanesulfonate monooxygenase SsuD and methylene tetrahydromethanopterin reductase) [Asanoa hainanensis]|uniref:Flavin-dependent oxidoreductase, luciferase family (Includes alkanesulfonate monooxygenase SsuD and methylene tetrahydromethanopterin reductase) n=1 Tax=Asanoa hainanensis TaxID=560556 RepID=A0A239NJW1_9ACTN|nr:LLM class flavin-dependent oxidoreductase [Asanoa hainanensis]SNT55050.1 Flavin-dependent oxidoreductase, luciferase family (includes alkanesulfonate monooxygenase SsuD and methylene tetrahydromethanopterin reductase) [Asanoa hainanensis]
MILLNIVRPIGTADPVALAGTALAAGLDGIALADSPRLFPDCLVETERVLGGTTARLAGPCVLSLGLRHPATVAGAVRTLDGHHPGRVFTVVGRGESSVRNEGVAPPSLRAYEESLRTLRELVPPSAVVLGAASGPRTIASTAALLGGVLVDAGADPAIVGKAVALARSERPDATVWMFVRAVVTDDPDAAAPVLGSCAARLVRAPDWFDVPADRRPAVSAVADAHDYRRHGTADARRGEVPAGADRFVRDRFVVTGDPAAVTARFAEFRALGVDGVVLAGALDGVWDRLDELGTAVRTGMGES